MDERNVVFGRSIQSLSDLCLYCKGERHTNGHRSTFLIKSLHSPVERERRLNSKFERPYELLESIIRKREGQRVDPAVCLLYILLYIYIYIYIVLVHTHKLLYRY